MKGIVVMPFVILGSHGRTVTEQCCHGVVRDSRDILTSHQSGQGS